MGRDKAWVHAGGRPLIVRTLDTLRDAGIREIFISGRSDADYTPLGCPVLFDLEPGLGPLGGIERGLCCCTSPLLLVVAVDMARLSGEFLRGLVGRADHSTGVVPQCGRRLEPLAAIYPRRCHPFAFNRILAGSRAARDFATDCLREGAVRRWRLPPSRLLDLTNWNRPEDVTDTPAAPAARP
jgi:molybdopterin-guanine dinucleotide biosynthesis protein A